MDTCQLPFLRFNTQLGQELFRGAANTVKLYGAFNQVTGWQPRNKN